MRISNKFSSSPSLFVAIFTNYLIQLKREQMLGVVSVAMTCNFELTFNVCIGIL